MTMRMAALAATLAGATILALFPTAAPAAPLTGDTIKTAQGPLVIHPVNHASFVMSWKGMTIYVDPVGGIAPYQDLPKPDLILVTDIHGDHLNAATLSALVNPTTPIVAPAAVRAQVPANLQQRIHLLANGETAREGDIGVEAVAMYNTTPERLQNHTKGRGNGYVLTFGATRVYIAGDTEPTPEMLALKNIDVAFLPMNLPYTMTPQQAAEAVHQFKPKIVYPYHYRGQDTAAFARLVGKDAEVRLRNWYE